MIKLLQKENIDFFEPLHQMLQKIIIPSKTSTNNRRGFPVKHRAFTFGITKARFSGIIGLSYYSKMPMFFVGI